MQVHPNHPTASLSLTMVHSLFKLVRCYFLLCLSVVQAPALLSLPTGTVTHYRNLAKGRIDYRSYGYDTRFAKRLKANTLVGKYGVVTTDGLQALATMELQIYERIKDLNGTVTAPVARPKSEAFTLSPNFTGQAEFLTDMHEYLADFESSSLQLLIHSKRTGQHAHHQLGKLLAGNPNCVFKMTKRVRNYLQKWASKPQQRGSASLPQQHYLYRYLKREYQTSDGPSLADLQIIMTAIIMLQHNLDLGAADVAAGIFKGKRTGVTLRAIDCLEIGLHAIACGKFAIGVEWLEVAVEKVRLRSDKGLDFHLASQLLDTARATVTPKYYAENLVKRYAGITLRSEISLQHDNFLKNATSWPAIGDFFHTTPFSGQDELGQPTEQRRKRWEKRELIRALGPSRDNISSSEIYRPTEPNMSFIEPLLVWSACKGERRQTDLERPRLFCWYETEVHPSWKIGPLKAELLSRHPHTEIVLFYDLVGDEDLRRVKSATMYNYAAQEFYWPLADHSAVDHLKPTQTLLHIKLCGLSQRATGLKCGEQYYERLGIRVTGYPAAGFVGPHVDGYCGRQSETDTGEETYGNAMATLTVYLEEPEYGGETAFAYSKVTVQPRKGSALFWYNLKGSGLCDQYAFHGTCPVILGSKSILSFWPQYNDQTHLACAPAFGDGESRMEILVNGKTKY